MIARAGNKLGIVVGEVNCNVKELGVSRENSAFLIMNISSGLLVSSEILHALTEKRGTFPPKRFTNEFSGSPAA